jgi:Spy/CpxP family protein refolding chaperone
MGFAIVVSVKAQEIPERKMDKPGMHHGKHDRGMRDRHDRMKMMAKDLNLTEQQKAQLKKNREDLRSRFEALKKEDNITVKEYRSRMENLRKEQKNSFESVLTGEQKAIIEKKKTDAKGRFDHMADKRMEGMKTRLGLTDEQAVQMKKNREEMQSRLKAIREDKTLSAEQKKEAFKTEMKAQREKNNSILTEDQKKKMKEMHEKKGDFKGRKPGERKEV